MIGKKIILGITLSLYVSCGFAQKKLFLKPHLGGQAPYAHYDRSVGKDNTFKPRYFDITDNYGIILQLKLNDTWRIATGWSKGNIGWGNKIRTPDKFSKNPYKGSSLHHSVSNYIHRFPVQISRKLKTIAYLPIDRNQNLYLFNFELHVLSGISIDHIDHKSRFDDYEEKWTFPYKDEILYQERISILNRWGASAMAGLGMQFYRLGKERFDLNLFYSQGIRNMIQSDVSYTMNTETRHSRMLTRGSFIGATLGYPIRLKTFKSKGRFDE
jgi:hypothetical protein